MSPFFDTNVLLYAVRPGDPRAERARLLLADGGIIPRDLRSAPGALAAVIVALRSSRLIPLDVTDPIAAAVDYSYL